MEHKNNCLICGKELIYSDIAEEIKLQIDRNIQCEYSKLKW